MKKNIVLVALLFSVVASYSQSTKIIGSWLWSDSANTISLFIKEDGTIQKRAGLSNDDIWSKKPVSGTYTFNKDQSLVITWSDKSIEQDKVKFPDKFTAAIQFTDPITKSRKTYVFKKIIDEEVVPDK